jgi:hypothetical protein
MFGMDIGVRYRLGQLATQNRSAVRQSSSASAHTNRHRSKFAAAVVRHAVSPPAQMLSPSVIRWHACTSARRLVTHAVRQVFLVAWADAKQVDSLVTHFFALGLLG